MEPIDFKGRNAIFGLGQHQYRPLPAHVDPDGRATACWSLSWAERLRVLWTGRIWFTLSTQGRPIQPQLASTIAPFFDGPPDDEGEVEERRKAGPHAPPKVPGHHPVG